MSPYAIARKLTEDGIPSPAGKPKWNDPTIKRVLSNETYMGDKLLQKTYSNDFLDKTRRKNEGQVPQVYVEGCHEAIIPARTFRRVQEEIERRKNCHASGGTIFSAKIFCGDCGQMFGPKVWHSKDPQYRRTVWQCNSKFKGHRCKTPHLTEEEIQQGFIKAMNNLLAIRQEVIANLREVQAELGGTEDLEAEIARLDNERTVTGKLLQELIDQNARVAQDQTDYQQRSDEMFARYEAVEKALAEAQESLRQKEKHNEQIEDFISEIETMPNSITDFRTDYWGHLVEKVTVHRKGKLVLSFSCGVEIEV